MLSSFRAEILSIQLQYVHAKPQHLQGRPSHARETLGSMLQSSMQMDSPYPTGSTLLFLLRIHDPHILHD